jgi:peptidoglycan/LPS O-acetylase OafA/YrhL
MWLVVREASHPGPRERADSDESPVTGPRPGYVPALDGVRALAVAAVLGFHGGVSWLGGGFLGVDAFFVLSGYLITGLLLAEWQRTGSLDLVAFWGRRARRLLPALVVVVATVAAAGPALLPASELERLRQAAWATLLYLNNWNLVVGDGDYFAQTAAPSPLEHTWSLAIEEQFYVLWPVVLVLVLRARHPLRSLVLVCAAGVLASVLVLGAMHDPFDPGRVYYGTDARGASLLVGAALAALLTRRGVLPALAANRSCRSVLAVLALVGAGVTLWAWTNLRGADPLLYRGGLLATALAVVAVLAHVAVVPNGLTARVLSLPPLPLLGLVSYGIYLWHWPLFIAINADRTGLDGTPLLVVRCAATVVVATASYLIVERPIRRGHALRGGPWAATVGVVGVAACGVLVAVVTLAPRLPQPAGGEGLPDRVAAGGGLAELRLEEPDRGGGHTSASRQERPHVHRVRPGRPVVVDVFGDSVAWSLVTYLPERRLLDVRDRTLLGCGVTLTAPYRYFGHTYPTTWRSCRPWVRLWKRAVARDDPDIALIMVGRWETMDRVLEGRWTHIGDPVFDAHLRRRLEVAISIAGAHGARVLLATLPYNRRGEQLDGSLFPEDRPERVEAWNRIVRDVASSQPRVSVIELGERITPEGRFTWTAGGYTMRTDGLHLSPDGVRGWIAPWLFPRLLAAAWGRGDPG